MRSTSILSSTTVALLVAGILTLAPAVGSADLEPPMRLRANGGHTSGLTTMVDLSINSWSSPDEHRAITRAAAEAASVRRGDTAVRDFLQASGTRGRISFPGDLGIDVRYAYQFENEGRRTIVLAADRPINVEEASQPGLISLDFNVMLAIIELDESGQGAGDLWVAATIGMDPDGKFVAEGLDQDPIHLGSVRVVN